MRRKPIEYNYEFIIETVVLLYSETRITIDFDTSMILVTLGCQTPKMISGHDIYNKVNFGLRKSNLKKF